jgi:hypothetical protein
MRVNASDYKISTRDTTEDKFYTINGLESFIDDNGDPRTTKESDSVYAKAIKSYSSKDLYNKTLQYRYYILTDSNNNLYNPIEESSLLSITTKNQSYINKVCKNEQIFTEVSQNIFSQYISFLRTKSKKFLISAQREI